MSIPQGKILRKEVRAWQRLRREDKTLLQNENMQSSILTAGHHSQTKRKSNHVIEIDQGAPEYGLDFIHNHTNLEITQIPSAGEQIHKQ